MNEKMTKAQLQRKMEEMSSKMNALEKNEERLKQSNALLIEKEKQYKKSEETYKVLTEGLKDVVIRVSLTGILEYCSPVVKEFGGYDAKKELGQHIQKYFAGKSELLEAVEKLKSVALEEETTSFEFMFVAKNRADFPVEISTKRLNRNGRVIALLCVMRDISRRKKAEEEKLQLEEKLIQSEKMEALGKLAAGVAHDLNNVLSAMVSYPDLLLMKLPEESPFRKSILTIKKSGQKAATIVDDLLTLARRGVKTEKVVNLNDIVKEYLDSPEHKKLLSYHHDVTIKTHIDTDLSNILGSPVHLVKALMNLVYNSAEAMPRGGEITISTVNLIPRASADKYELNEYAVLTVTDNGIGIPPADFKKIFDPFYTKKRMGRSGSGLGMAVVWGAVQDHKGYINAHSRETEGSTFELYFPVTWKNLCPEESNLPIEDYIGNGEKILIVDDVPEQREITLKILVKLNYDVHTAASGEKAVEFLKRDNTFQLVILDMLMGTGMDGLDTFKKIKALNPGIKALIASGFSETNRVKEAINLGVGEYIKKPFTFEQIGIGVKRALDS
ncbi:MAG: response regulator [bacterium]|nr:response regulator [bacterium]